MVTALCLLGALLFVFLAVRNRQAAKKEFAEGCGIAKLLADGKLQSGDEVVVGIESSIHGSVMRRGDERFAIQVALIAICLLAAIAFRP